MRGEPVLKFEKMVFHQGINATFRNGWLSQEELSGMVVLRDANGLLPDRRGYVLDISRHWRSTLDGSSGKRIAFALSHTHDPECNTVAKLIETMDRHYVKWDNFSVVLFVVDLPV